MSTNPVTPESSKIGYIVGGVVALVVLGGIGYLAFGRKSTPAAPKSKASSTAAVTANSPSVVIPTGANKLESLNVSGDAVLQKTTIGGADGTPIPILRWGRQAVPENIAAQWTVEFGYTFAQPPMVILGVPEYGKPDYTYIAHLSEVTRSSFTYRFFFFDKIGAAPAGATLYRCPDAHVINYMIIGQSG